MAKNTNTTNKKDFLNSLKMEAAAEVGVDLIVIYGELTSKEAGKIGGQMVKKMVKDYEAKMK